MECDLDKYAVTSVIGATGALHAWHSTDGNARRVQSGCFVVSNASISSLYGGARVLAAARNKGGSTTVVTHDMSRAGGAPVARSGSPETTLTALRVSPDDSVLVGGGTSGRIYVWMYSTGSLCAKFDAHLGAVEHFEFTADGSVLLSGGRDGRVHAWNVHEIMDAARDQSHILHPAKTIRAHSLPILTLTVGGGLPASTRVITTAADRTTRLWHLGSGRQVGHVQLPASCVSVALAVTETVAYVACANGDILIVNLPTLPAGDIPVSHTRIPKLRAPASEHEITLTPTALALSPSSHQIIVGYNDGIVRVFDAVSRIVVHVYRRHNVAHPVTALLVSHPIPLALKDTVAATSALSGTTSAISDVQMAPPPALAKTVLDASGETVLHLGTAVDIIQESWEFISDAPEWKHNYNFGNAPATDESIAMKKELEDLRARNKQLERAGALLCDLVQSAPN